jgi:ATP-dependent DNA helicase RecQ
VDSPALLPDASALDTARRLLAEVFGFRAFVGLQEEIIGHVLSGGDALAVMPTGGGKSLCYQLPALVRPGLGLVVSPLIALMQDQVQSLSQAGVRAAALNSGLSATEAQRVWQALLSGRLDLLYVAPERVVLPQFLDFLSRAPLSVIAIDEAHCVSQWGHDFRPEYGQLAVLAELFPGVPRLALTATADGPTRADIVSRLSLPRARIFVASFDRPNIRYRVATKGASPLSQVLDFIRTFPPRSSGIVYRMSRAGVEEAAEALDKAGVPALPYHAGLADQVRRENQERFMREPGLTMVATVAFGMGVDKPDVRFVVHMDPPKSLEAYHQETGRAGRDGEPAEALLLFGLSDMVFLRRLLGEGEGAHKQVERVKLDALAGYCETPGCRRQVLLGYFGERLDAPCGRCDTCEHPPETFDGLVCAQKALSCAFRTGQRFGAGHLCDVLCGNVTERIGHLGHDHVSTFGIGSEFDRRGWMSVFRQMVSLGFLMPDLDRYGGLTITPAGWEVLRGQREVLLRRDPVGRRERRKRRRSVGDALPVGEAEGLFEALRLKRQALARAEGVPPYAVFPDKTLKEMVAYRPETLEGMALLHGIGRRKHARYSAEFLEVLQAHATEHGRPSDLPELPEAPARRVREKKAGEEEGLSATIARSVELFREHGDLTRVALARGLTPVTIANHLVVAVAAGEVEARAASNLSQEVYDCLAATIRAFLSEGIDRLIPLSEALGGSFGYETLRLVRAGVLREDGEG